MDFENHSIKQGNMQEKTDLSLVSRGEGDRYSSRMGSNSALLLFVFFFPNSLAAQIPPGLELAPETWAATDGLGRSLPTEQLASPDRKVGVFYLTLTSRSRGERYRPARRRQSGTQRHHRSDASRSVHPATIERMVSQPSASTRMTCGTTNSTKSQSRPKCQRRA